MKKQKSKETILAVDTTGGNLNGVPPIQFLVAMQGLEALNRGMKLCRNASAQNCMAIISRVTGQTYKRTDRNRALRDAGVVHHAMQEARKQRAADAMLQEAT